MHRRQRRILTIVLGLAAAACVVGLALMWSTAPHTGLFGPKSRLDRHAHDDALTPPERLSPFQTALMTDLDRQVKAKITYRDGYYMGGDPPPGLGVCSDVVVRSYRAAGVDLQRELNRDMRAHPAVYGRQRPDRNIDHRRCRNLIVYFKRHARALPRGSAGVDWQPGDVVFWDTSGDGAVHHVGMIANGRDAHGDPTIVHHWPGLPVSETDGLFVWPILGHFRWTQPVAASIERAPRPRAH